MQTLLSRLRGWRHGRGFGIHSPFAFRFITEVLRQKLGTMAMPTYLPTSACVCSTGWWYFSSRKE